MTRRKAVEAPEPEEFSDMVKLEPESPPMEPILNEALARMKMPVNTTGATNRGWSRMKALQTCPYLYAVKYRDLLGDATPEMRRRPAMDIGSLGHACLAIYYTRGWRKSQALKLISIVRELGGDGEVCDEVERCLAGYWNNYGLDYFRVLAAEHEGVDVEGNTCRFDLVVEVSEDRPEMPAGIYEVEHKFKSRFDASALMWENDGEVLGQINAGQTQDFVDAFGRPLDGVIVNVIGRQKEQKFARKVISAQNSHAEHMTNIRVFRAHEATYDAMGVWPRARAGCIGQFGPCDLYSHCADGVADS